MRAASPTPHLPDELLLIIFHNLLPQQCIICQEKHNKVICDVLLPLSLGCKRFRTLANELYYTSNMFVIERKGARPFLHTRAEPFRYPPFKFGHYVRHVALHLRHPSFFFEEPYDFLSVGSDLSRLWRPKRALPARGKVWGRFTEQQNRWYHDTRTYWQRYLPNLEFVHVRLDFNRHASERELERMQDLSQLASVPLRSKMVQVQVLVQNCYVMIPGWPEWVEDVPCTRVLEKTLEEMMCVETAPKNDKTQGDPNCRQGETTGSDVIRSGRKSPPYILF